MNLKRFFTAVNELCTGWKQGLWMWFIVPQLPDLGFSSYAQLCAIRNLDEAGAYLEHLFLDLNFLKIDTEKPERNGFAQLLKGCFAAVRNPLAHQPKILWQGEEDAADYFSLISLLHRKLDSCVRTKSHCNLQFNHRPDHANH